MKTPYFLGCSRDIEGEVELEVLVMRKELEFWKFMKLGRLTCMGQSHFLSSAYRIAMGFLNHDIFSIKISPSSSKSFTIHVR